MNIYEIAARCGVSIATVSRVLNNSPQVKAQTREKVLEVMRQENYTPSALARGLGGGSMRLAGVVCRDMQNAFHAAAVVHVEKQLRERGLHTLLRCVGTQPQELQQAMDSLLQQGAEALVVIGAACQPEEEPLFRTAAARAPVMLLNGTLPVTGVYGVAMDERGAVRQLVEALFRRQKKKILLLHEGDTYSCREKMAGYREGHEAAGEVPRHHRMVAVSREPEAVNACMKQLLVQRVSFDAVIASEDVIALGAQKALQRIGLTMPVVGFDNSLLARCSIPELTSVDTRVEVLCEKAVELLQAVLDKKEVPPFTVLPTTLAERDTFRLN